MRTATRIAGILAVALLVSLVVWSLASPDLSKCTRLRIRYENGAMVHFFAGNGKDNLFTEAEQEYIRSFNTWVISDPNQIRSFAKAVGQVARCDRIPSLHSGRLRITCYRCIWPTALLETELAAGPNWDSIRYPQAVLLESILVPPGIEKLRPRYYCVHRIKSIPVWEAVLMRKASAYPDPNRWCDAVVESLRQKKLSRNGGPPTRSHSDAGTDGTFRCPAMKPLDEPVREWVSDYTMNPFCEPNSPKDTVLLFESKPGWNQHGGPELFTFDNHDPKGGCVLLNDGTVKFVRTKEELAQLRWK